ncbi:hypothetical protein SOASR031_13750 [Leminorella grimontii]|nr:hypothetical protein SOASR031_13750 [Leminorella grimontii]
MKEKATQLNLKEQGGHLQSEQDVLSRIPLYIRRGSFSRAQLYEIAFECMRKLEVSEKV